MLYGKNYKGDKPGKSEGYVVSGKEQVEMFANAIEESYQESLKRHNNPTSLKYRELKGSDEIKEFMKKWNKVHKIGKV